MGYPPRLTPPRPADRPGGAGGGGLSPARRVMMSRWTRVIIAQRATGRGGPRVAQVPGSCLDNGHLRLTGCGAAWRVSIPRNAHLFHEREYEEKLTNDLLDIVDMVRGESFAANSLSSSIIMMIML